MKDVRGYNVTAVRNAASKKFGLQLASGRRRNSQDVSTSEKVDDSYKRLFTEDDAIDNITLSAFPLLKAATDDEYNDWYIYTASVCDIILNPSHHTVITQKSLELRLQKFKVFYLLGYFVILKI